MLDKNFFLCRFQDCGKILYKIKTKKLQNNCKKVAKIVALTNNNNIGVCMNVCKGAYIRPYI